MKESVILKNITSKNVWKEIFEWIVCAITAYIIYLILNYFIGTISGIKQTSMYPNCKEGEKVIISRRKLWNKELKTGDIVTLEAPIYYEEKLNDDMIADYPKYEGINWFTYEIMGIGKKSYIKRIIATEGEHIYISEEGKVYVNDNEFEEPYLKESTFTTRSGEYYDLIVPEGCVFVMGDNRKESVDSRILGAIPIQKIEGKVISRIWPLNRIGKIGE